MLPGSLLFIGMPLQEGVTDNARGRAAVFRTLREVVGEKEFSDVDAQLPDEYAALLLRA